MAHGGSQPRGPWSRVISDTTLELGSNDARSSACSPGGGAGTGFRAERRAQLREARGVGQLRRGIREQRRDRRFARAVAARQRDARVEPHARAAAHHVLDLVQARRSIEIALERLRPLGEQLRRHVADVEIRDRVVVAVHLDERLGRAVHGVDEQGVRAIVQPLANPRRDGPRLERVAIGDLGRAAHDLRGGSAPALGYGRKLDREAPLLLRRHRHAQAVVFERVPQLAERVHLVNRLEQREQGAAPRLQSWQDVANALAEQRLVASEQVFERVLQPVGHGGQGFHAAERTSRPLAEDYMRRRLSPR